MIDIVNVFQGYAEGLGWQFSYGNKSNQNLLESDKVADQIYFLLDPVKRVKTMSEFGGTTDVSFSGNFMLLVKSNLDNVYHNQKGVTQTDGKYEKNIEPLIETDIVLFEDLLNCSDYEVTTWEILDAINVLDANHDGIVVTYNIKII